MKSILNDAADECEKFLKLGEKTLKTAVSIEALVTNAYDSWGDQTDELIEQIEKEIEEIQNEQHPKGLDASAQFDAIAKDCTEYYQDLLRQRDETAEKVREMMDRTERDAKQVMDEARAYAKLIEKQAEEDDDETRAVAREAGKKNVDSANLLAKSIRDLANRRSILINDEMRRIVHEADVMIEHFTSENAENSWKVMTEKRLSILNKNLENLKNQKQDLEADKKRDLANVTRRVANWELEVERLGKLADEADKNAQSRNQSIKKEKN